MICVSWDTFTIMCDLVIFVSWGGDGGDQNLGGHILGEYCCTQRLDLKKLLKNKFT